VATLDNLSGGRAILSVGRYVLLGIPAPSEIIQFEA